MVRARSLFFVSTLILFVTVGCARKVEPPAPPALAMVHAVWPGDPLSGRSATTQPAISTVLAADVQWFALEQVPHDGLMPMDIQARLTTAPLLGVGVLPSGKILGPARFGKDREAADFIAGLQQNRYGRTAKISESTGLVAPGVTRTFTAADPRPGSRGSVSLGISPTTKPANTAMLAVTMIGKVVLAESADPQSPPPAEWGQETALLTDIPCQPGATYVLAAPFDWGQKPWTALAVTVTLRDPPDRDAAAKQIAAELAVPVAGGPVAGKPRDFANALAAVAEAKSPRAPLMNLTAVTGSTIAHDMILSADDYVVRRFANHLRITAPSDVEAMQFYFDRIALQWMCDMAQKNALAPELASVLALHTGELSRRPDAVLDILKNVQTSAALQERIIAENFIALEDSAPAARVRAYDWLAARGKAPAGFDPLADGKSRRAAIEKALNP